MNTVDPKSSTETLDSSKEIIDDSEDESGIVEESPCGRWLKRREEVKYLAYGSEISNCLLLFVTSVNF